MRLICSIAILATSIKAGGIGEAFNRGVQKAKDEDQGGPGGRAIVAMLGDQFDNIDGYGCWCYFDDNHGRGRSHPVNEMDALCKYLVEGYDCAIIDADLEGATEACIPWEVSYTAASIGDNVVEECNEHNTDNCAIRACIVESTFATSVFRLMISGAQLDMSAKHANGFDVDANCPTTQGTPSEKECCGTYPYRHPYKTYGGQRSCCGHKTYDVTILNCCPSGKVKLNC